MRRREFLTGTAALCGASVITSDHAPIDARPITGRAALLGQATWRLQYPPTKQETRSDMIVKDRTFPPGDPRRY